MSRRGVFAVDGYLDIVGGMEGFVSMTGSLDKPCFGFLLPQQLGRLPVSSILDKVFLFSKAVGQDWVRMSSSTWTASSFARHFPLFSFIVAIPIQKKEDRQSLDELNE